MDGLEDKTPTVEQKTFANTSSSGSSGQQDDGDDEDLTPDSPPPGAAISDVNNAMSVSVPAQALPSTSDLSASYHEIFDTQMMPPHPHPHPHPPSESAKAAVQLEEEEEEVNVIIRDSAASAPCQDPHRLRGPPVPNCDHNTEATTQYLTSKLVQDSLRWQSDHHHRGASPSSSFPSSPLESPSRKLGARRKGGGGGTDPYLAEEFRLVVHLWPHS